MRRSVIVDTSVRVLFLSILVLSLYFLFAGHNQPGGGFVGGLVAGAAIALRYVAGGVDEVRTALRWSAETLLGVGLLVAALTAVAPIVLGHDVLDHAYYETTLGALGDVKVTSALPFDIGVYLVVLGLIMMMFEAFGDEIAFDESIDEFGPEPTSSPASGQTMEMHDLDLFAELAERRRVAGRGEPDEAGSP
jgi:multisubunit Na+/H+ antiporter MnhB subunit